MPIRALALSAIRAYQRYLSPHKGFCCAYRAHTGRRSCSALGYRAVRRHGVLKGLAILRRRLYLCGVAHRRYSTPHRRPLRQQRGDCDPGCDIPCDCNCDWPGDKSCGKRLGDVSCCDCGSCDWPKRKKKDRQQEKDVHLPPKAAGKQARAG
ncbi:hypothetical protein CJ010_00930 [Azoarcus sp. DD4]|nr:hypothetical protein CJ010_00930 [Azoarcus sp. DD4]